MKTIKYIILMTMLLSTPALALGLQSARNDGLVVEQPTGYIKAAKPSKEVNALVADVNAKRKIAYARIAKEKNSNVKAVASVAARELLKK